MAEMPRVSDVLATGCTTCVGPPGVVTRRMRPRRRKPTYRLPSGPSAVAVARLPARPPPPPASRVRLPTVSVAGSNVSRQTPWLLAELSGTYTTLCDASKVGWPGETILAVSAQVFWLSATAAGGGKSTRQKPSAWSATHRWVPRTTCPPGLVMPEAASVPAGPAAITIGVGGWPHAPGDSAGAVAALATCHTRP